MSQTITELAKNSKRNRSSNQTEHRTQGLTLAPRFDAGDANLYRYVGNAPTNGTDPFGLVVVGEQGAILTKEPQTAPAKIFVACMASEAFFTVAFAAAGIPPVSDEQRFGSKGEETKNLWRAEFSSPRVVHGDVGGDTVQRSNQGVLYSPISQRETEKISLGCRNEKAFNDPQHVDQKRRAVD